MSPEAQRIAIAEACPELVEWHDGIPYWNGCWSGFGEGNEHVAEFRPRTDLNAMHEAEKVLTAICEINAYITHLGTVLGRGDKTLFEFTHATAAQRAEAFLRTIGKWEDEQ
jgi:hypothetical protein